MVLVKLPLHMRWFAIMSILSVWLLGRLRVAKNHDENVTLSFPDNPLNSLKSSYLFVPREKWLSTSCHILLGVLFSNKVILLNTWKIVEDLTLVFNFSSNILGVPITFIKRAYTYLENGWRIGSKLSTFLQVFGTPLI